MKRGFTLIEILVVMGVLSILIGISAFSLSIIRGKGRDAQRQSDVRVIQAALQQYYADQGFYPATYSFQQGPPSTSPVTTLTSSVGNPCIPSCPSPVRVYLNLVPVDPQLSESNNRQHYCYQAQASLSDTSACDNDLTDGDLAGMCYYYSLYTNLETATGNSYTCFDRAPPFNHAHTENFVVNPL